jgi:hypothetical protein
MVKAIFGLLSNKRSQLLYPQLLNRLGNKKKGIMAGRQDSELLTSASRRLLTHSGAESLGSAMSNSREPTAKTPRCHGDSKDRITGELSDYLDMKAVDGIPGNGNLPTGGNTRHDPYAKLALYDTVLLIDDSASMNETDNGTSTRWSQLKDVLSYLAPVVTQYDNNGIDVYFLNQTLLDTSEVTDSDKVEELFVEAKSGDGTPIGSRLKGIFEAYLAEYQKHLVEHEEHLKQYKSCLAEYESYPAEYESGLERMEELKLPSRPPTCYARLKPITTSARKRHGTPLRQN